MLLRSRLGLLLALVLACCWRASGVSAQDGEFARSGVLSFGVDRIFGVMRVSYNVEGAGGGESTASITEISLLTGGGGTSPYALPRVTLDGFVTDGISLGGTLGVVTQSSDSEVEAGGASTSSDGPSGTGFFVGGRLGYGHMFTDVVGLWPKLGLTFFTFSAEDDDGDESDLSGLALSADVALLVAPVSHFAFTISPVLDLGLTGSAGNGDSDVDTTITNFGLQFGVLGYL